MKRIVDISDDTFNTLKDIVETDCVDPYSLADIIVNKSIPLQECEFLSTLMQSVMTTEQLKEVFQKMVEEKNRWIPVSERLPEIATTCLVQLSNGYITMGKYHSIRGGSWVFIDTTIQFVYPKDSVIAWQPLPEPYKKEGAE